jgi:RNA polymerase sigma-70 factor (ECF subfamily)
VLVETAFREYGKAMLGVMIRFCGDEQAAQDGVSHAFAQALARKRTLEAMPAPAMRAWLYAAARNAVVDIKRREARFSLFPEGDALFADTRLPDLAGRAAAEALLRELPRELGVIVRMKYYGQMNASQIGLALGVPPATVRTRLRKALRIMREKSQGVKAWKRIWNGNS